MHVPDILAAADEFPVSARLAQRFGYRASLNVPLRRQDQAIGVLGVTMDEPRKYSAQEVALLESFADQAVVAIENARLFSEIQARLEEQVATGRVMRVLAESPTDAQRVLDAIVETAARLCESDQAAILLSERDTVRPSRSAEPEGCGARSLSPAPPGRRPTLWTRPG